MTYLLYDADCSLCAYLAAWAHTRDRHRQRLAILALQTPQARALALRLSDADYHQSFHVVRHGRVVSGDRAIPLVLQQLPNWRMLGWCMQYLPGGGWVTARFYQWLARRRERGLAR